MGGAITVIPPNIWQDNLLTGSTPYVVYPRVKQRKTGRFPSIPNHTGRVAKGLQHSGCERAGQWQSENVPANTVMDVNRYQQDCGAGAESSALAY